MRLYRVCKWLLALMLSAFLLCVKAQTNIVKAPLNTAQLTALQNALLKTPLQNINEKRRLGRLTGFQKNHAANGVTNNAGRLNFGNGLPSPQCSDSSFVNFYSNQGSNIYSQAFIETSNGDLLIAGSINDVSSGKDDFSAFVAKLDSKGNVLWVKLYNDVGTRFFTFYNLYEAQNGDIIVAGDIAYKTGDPNSLIYYTTAVRLTSTGNILWQKEFNTKLQQGVDNCKNEASFFINSVNEGLHGDIIFNGTSLGCPGPQYQTVLLTDKNGNFKWDFSFMHASSYTQGASAVVKDGNILAMGMGLNVFSGGDGYIELHFITLNYATGQIMSTKAYSMNQYEGFLSYTVQMQPLNNGHYAVYGKSLDDAIPDDGKDNIYVVLDFNDTLGFTKAYALAGNYNSNDGQAGYVVNNAFVDKRGRFSYALFQYPVQNTENIYTGNIENGRILKNKFVQLYDSYTYGNANAYLTHDGATMLLHDRQLLTPISTVAELRKIYNSDTSKTQCLGRDTALFYTRPVVFKPYENLWITDSFRQQLYTGLSNITASPANLTLQNGCSLISRCDTVKIHGKFSFCGNQPTAVFTAYKRPACGAVAKWGIDSSGVKSISYLNDTSVSITFNNNWKGKLYATIDGGSCMLPVTDSAAIAIQSNNTVLNLGPDTSICAGNSITLKTGGFNTYKWQDGSKDSVFTVSKAGKYYVTVNDYCGNAYSDTVKVAMASYYFSAGNDTAKCNNDSVALSATAGFINYNWQPAYNITSTTGAATTVYPLKDTSYIVTAEKFAGCFVKDTVHIKALSSPAIRLGNDTSFCAGQSVWLDAGPGFVFYKWSTAEVSQKINVSAAGYYSVKAIAANNCPSFDTLQVVNVNSVPAFSLGPDTTLCNGQVLNYSFNIAGATYLWGTGSNSNTQVVNAPGAYTLAVTQGGCTSNDTVTVAYNASPIIMLGNDTTLCAGVTALLTPAVGNTTYTYKWQDGSTNAYYNVVTAGTYSVTALLGNCKASDTVVIQYADKPHFNLGNDTSICTGEQLLLKVDYMNGSYLWQDGSTQQTYLVKQPGVYNVTVTNGCGSQSDIIKIDSTLCSVLLPNAFTPNGDGLNDVFKLKYPAAVKTFYLSIFNRWGQRVFETTNAYAGWNGLYNGLLQPTGAFVYYMVYTDNAGKKGSQKGTVILLK